MSPEVPRGRPLAGTPSTDLAAASVMQAADVVAACTAYVVILVTPRDKLLRKPYLSLHSAQQVLRRAQDRGQAAHLVLCKLEPVTVADLDLGGGEQL
jgi:hypothetical protein